MSSVFVIISARDEPSRFNYLITDSTVEQPTTES